MTTTRTTSNPSQQHNTEPVDPDGNIFELRTPKFAGDTATRYDPTGHFLVVCARETSTRRL